MYNTQLQYITHYLLIKSCLDYIIVLPMRNNMQNYNLLYKIYFTQTREV